MEDLGKSDEESYFKTSDLKEILEGHGQDKGYDALNDKDDVFLNESISISSHVKEELDSSQIWQIEDNTTWNGPKQTHGDERYSDAISWDEITALLGQPLPLSRLTLMEQTSQQWSSRSIYNGCFPENQFDRKDNHPT